VSTLELFASGGAPSPPTLASAVGKIKNTIPANGYGLTETNGRVAGISGTAYLEKPRSCGPSQMIMESKIVDQKTDQDVGKNVPGELWVKGVLVMKEYFKNPKATAQALTPDFWFKTGDIAEIDNDGYIYILDRAKDIIIRGGENIACSEVEAAFYTHPSVQEIAAIAIPNERFGEVVGVMVMFKEGHQNTKPAELVHHVQGKLSPFKIPDESAIFISREPLPRGGTGKIDKKVIRGIVAKKTKVKSKL